MLNKGNVYFTSVLYTSGKKKNLFQLVNMSSSLKAECMAVIAVGEIAVTFVT